MQPCFRFPLFERCCHLNVAFHVAIYSQVLVESCVSLLREFLNVGCRHFALLGFSEVDSSLDAFEDGAMILEAPLIAFKRGGGFASLGSTLASSFAARS